MPSSTVFSRIAVSLLAIMTTWQETSAPSDGEGLDDFIVDVESGFPGELPHVDAHTIQSDVPRP